jgi:hypothetical protein
MSAGTPMISQQAEQLPHNRVDVLGTFSFSERVLALQRTLTRFDDWGTIGTC